MGTQVTLGGGQPLHFALSFGEIPWFDVRRGEIQPCDWSANSLSYMCPVWIPRLWTFPSQSQRCISLRTSNHGISPNVSANCSGWLPSITRLCEKN